MYALQAQDAIHFPNDRRATESAQTRWFALMLDEIDYGVLMLDGSGHVLHANHAARAELGNNHPLKIQDNLLRAQRPHDGQQIADALDAARRGLRRMLQLGKEDGRVGVAVVPLPGREGVSPGRTLVLLGKRQVCERLSMECFARIHALTPAECRVLESLCAGSEPGEIALQQSVAVSTVRTQISAIRNKTGAKNIRALVRMISVLPPLLGALRGATAVSSASWQ